MKLAKRLCTTLFVTLAVSASCPAQSVFQATLLTPFSDSLSFFDGIAYFDVDASTVQYQIDFLNTSPPPNLSAFIGALGDILIVPLGVGTPAGWSNDTGDMYPDPFVPPPDHTFGSPLDTRGTQYNGSFQSSSALYDAFLLGRGQIQLSADGTDYGTGAIETVVVPEPGNVALFSCGLMLFLIPAVKHPVTRFEV